MGIYTNEVDISALTSLDVSSASLTADKTNVVAGNTVNLKITVNLTRYPTSTEAQYYGIWATMYVNGSKTQDIKLTHLSSSAKTYASTVQFTPSSAGTYKIKFYVYLGPYNVT